MLIYLDKKNAEKLIDILEWYKVQEETVSYPDSDQRERSKQERKLCEELISTLHAML